MLNIENVEVIYSDVILVLKGVSLNVPAGKIISLLGANGAGKTTTLKAISGLLHTELGQVTDGSITFDGKPIHKLGPEEIVRKGIVQVLEGRPTFEQLTTEENLLVGASSLKDKSNIKSDLDRIYGYFPRLKELRKRISGYLSGGEKQMQVIGRALMAHPQLMLLDEPSLGLSPLMVDQIFEIIETINVNEKTSMLLVEQNAMVALSISHHGFVMENGRIVMEDTSVSLMQNEDIKEFYLGLSSGGARKNYRDVKHYRRRKRWLA